MTSDLCGNTDFGLHASFALSFIFGKRFPCIKTVCYYLDQRSQLYLRRGTLMTCMEYSFPSLFFFFLLWFSLADCYSIPCLWHRFVGKLVEWRIIIQYAVYCIFMPWPERFAQGHLEIGSSVCLSIRNSVPFTNKKQYLKFGRWYSNQTWTVSSSMGSSHFTDMIHLPPGLDGVKMYDLEIFAIFWLCCCRAHLCFIYIIVTIYTP